MKYYDNPALSYSKLKLLDKSPKEFYLKYIKGEYEELESDALKLGKAFDLLLTDPHEFNKNFTVLEGVKTTTKPGFISEVQYKTFLEMRCELLKSVSYENGDFQKEIYWQDNVFMQDCKAKFDWIDVANGLIRDIKTCSSVEVIKWDFFKYGYNLQAAMYLRGAQQVFNKPFEIVFDFIEKSYPYEVKPVRLCNETLLKATAKIEELFLKYSDYKLNNKWLDVEELIL